MRPPLLRRKFSRLSPSIDVDPKSFNEAAAIAAEIQRETEHGLQVDRRRFNEAAAIAAEILSELSDYHQSRDWLQ